MNRSSIGTGISMPGLALVAALVAAAPGCVQNPPGIHAAPELLPMPALEAPPPVERDQGGGAVLLGAALGAGTSLVGIFAMSFMNPAFNEANVPLLYGAGTSIGAMAGALLEARDPAPVSTITGTALGLLPLVGCVVLENCNGTIFGVALLTPIVGAVLGNVHGQHREPRPSRR